jgi:hypothetical protein
MVREPFSHDTHSATEESPKRHLEATKAAEPSLIEYVFCSPDEKKVSVPVNIHFKISKGSGSVDAIIASSC